MESKRHGLLEGSSSIFETKRHLTIGKCTPWTNECSFVLVFEFDLYLIIFPHSNVYPYDHWYQIDIWMWELWKSLFTTNTPFIGWDDGVVVTRMSMILSGGESKDLNLRCHWQWHDGRHVDIFGKLHGESIYFDSLGCRLTTVCEKVRMVY